MVDRGTRFTLVAVGLGLLYFGWLFSATGIVTNRGRAVTAAQDPERFSFAVGVVLAVGAVSLVWGIVTALWPRP